MDVAGGLCHGKDKESKHKGFVTFTPHSQVCSSAQWYDPPVPITGVYADLDLALTENKTNLCAEA